MKKIISLTVLAVALVFASNANAKILPISMGIKGGINSSTLKAGPNLKSRTGFNAGLTLDVNLPANLALMTGIEVTTKGTKMDKMYANYFGDYGNYEVTPGFKQNATYLQVPAHLGYRLKIIPGLRVHLEAGPYFAYGIGGKSSTTNTEGNKIKMNTFGDEGYKRFDWGLGVGAGVTVLGKIQVRAGYDWGLASINRGGDSITNKNFYTSVGYLFF